MKKEKEIIAPGVKMEAVLNPIEMMLRDKKIVESYFRGEISLNELHAKGIKFGR